LSGRLNRPDRIGSDEAHPLAAWGARETYVADFGPFGSVTATYA